AGCPSGASGTPDLGGCYPRGGFAFDVLPALRATGRPRPAGLRPVLGASATRRACARALAALGNPPKGLAGVFLTPIVAIAFPSPESLPITQISLAPV